jgi:hypothetical protein
MNRLQAALLAKFGTPERVLEAWGLSPSLLRGASDPTPPKPKEPSMTYRPNAGRAYARDQADQPDRDGGQSGAPSYSERHALVLKYLRGRLSDQDLLQVEALLRGDEAVIERAQQAAAEPAMDGRRLGSRRARELTSRIRIF